MSTITIPSHVPPVSDDCEQLRKAFAGWGTNEKLIISILGHRNSAQRNEIRKTYRQIYNEDLLRDLDKDLSGDFERLILLWTLDPSERDALLVKESTAKNWTTKNLILVEIACTRSSDEILLARKAYHARYKRSIEEDAARHSSGEFRKLLLPLIMAYRYEGDEVNSALAKTEANTLHEKITTKEFSDEELIRILTTQSRAQIIATLNHYKNAFGNDVNKDLKVDPKNEYLGLLRAVVKCLVRPEKYFSKTVRLAIDKRGTDEGALTRVLVTRADVDMKGIMEEYARRTSVPLERAIAKDTSGDYEAMLLALLGH